MTVLSPQQQDALKEIGSVGAGHAANSLASLLQTKIMVSTPSMSTIKLSELWADDEINRAAVVAIHMKILGDAPGRIIVAFDLEGAVDLARTFIKRVLKTEDPSQAEIDSTFQEFGNILAGSYLMALSSLTKLQFSLSEPTIISGSTQTVLQELLKGESDDDIVVIESHFISGDKIVPGQVILLPEPLSFSKLLAPLGA